MIRVKIVGFESCFYPNGMGAKFWPDWVRSNVDAPVRIMGEVDIIDNCIPQKDCRVQLERGGAYLTAREVLTQRWGL